MAGYVPITNILDFAVAFNPTSAFPLDARSMASSYTEAVARAAAAVEPGSTEGKYYIGQNITVYENDTVTEYKIQPDKTLKETGSTAITADTKSVVISNDVVSLKSFGEQYYKYIAADTVIDGTGFEYPNSMPSTDDGAADGVYVSISNTWYVYGEDAWAVADTDPVTTAYYSLTTGWTDGLEPKVIKNTDSVYELAWYEPSATTVEGLQSALASVQTEIDTMNDRVTALNTAQNEALAAEITRATEAESTLGGRITTNTTAITLLNSDASTEGSVKYQIAQAVANIMENPDETINSITELVDWISNHAEDALALSNNVTANSTAIQALSTLVGTLPEDITATTVIGYIAELVDAEKLRAIAAETALGNRIDALGTAANANTTDFATAAQGALAATAVQSVEESTTNGKISVDGVDVDVYELPVASSTIVGGVTVDNTSITADSSGKISVAAVDSSKVTGLDTSLTSTKEAAITSANEYTDENAVLVENIATSTDVAESVTDASDTKVISEKAVLDALTWKTSM